ncbi:DUF1330 domain-containing protein [Paraburkholderia sp. BL17N1]|uniref:DUF1330 domain-containing protein n=1 Tax=Paraburkholderia sp. BL17N1 TaxID=1938798 RepID=UPI000EB510A0|nr:DUF1330 domain-containing protein [Paraburkholderia sp. BL17N1]RKR45186.1 uncharacterized protein (DUF1330 family) [Paraburkholderia sp. BL17N1]
MKRKHILLAAIGATATLAASALTALAQTPASESQPRHGKTPAYYIADFELTDPEGIKPYRDQVDATFKAYSGRYIVRASNVVRLEGNPPKHRLIIIEFDSIDLARAWYNSPQIRQDPPVPPTLRSHERLHRRGTAAVADDPADIHAPKPRPPKRYHAKSVFEWCQKLSPPLA